MLRADLPPKVWAEIDTAALRLNVESVRARSGGSRMLAAVKADAYGHGAIVISKALVSMGVERLAVADLAEAAELREAGIDAPIHVLGPLLPSETRYAIGYDLVLTIGSIDEAEAISEQAVRCGTVEKVHLNLDTGMGRLGFRPDEAPEAAVEIAALPGVEVEGAMTHFPCADEEEDGFSSVQVALFKETVERIRRSGVRLPLLHAANSAGIARGLGVDFDTVRPGLALYGMAGLKSVYDTFGLQPILSLKSRVLALRRIQRGATVGYGRAWRAAMDSLIAVVGIGYADGYSRVYAERGEMLIRGGRAKVVGRISMDYTTVDVTQLPSVATGDEVVIIGRQEDESVSAEDLAAWSNTIPYEVTCKLGKRVRRMYLGSRPDEG